MDLAASQRLMRRFEELLTLPEGEWEDFLQRCAAREPELYPGLQELVLSHRQESGLLDEQQLDQAPGRLVTQLISEDPEDRPRRLGPYRILREIGRGGAGMVYEAEDPETGTRAAVKVLRVLSATEANRMRFEREARLLSRLDHPGIARILRADLEQGLPYFAMELVEGQTLIGYADAHQLDTEARLRLMVKVCEAVHHAHVAGVLHRDLKPSNILVDALGQPKVLDFGIARAVCDEGLQGTAPTITGQILGTLGYISPEQCVGEAGDLDVRCDVYALGVVTFELLAGRLPYPIAGKPMGAALRILLEEDAPHLGSLDRRLRGGIEAVVHRAMIKDRLHRYPSALAFATELRRLLRGEPVEARLPSLYEQILRFTRANTSFALGLCIAVCSLTLLAAGGTWFGILQAQLAQTAEDSKRTAEWELYRNRLVRATQALDAGQYQVAEQQLSLVPEDQRQGWEWRHLWQRHKGGGHAFMQQSTPAQDCWQDPGGRWLLVRSLGDELARIDLQDLSETRPIPLPERARICGMHPDGRVLFHQDLGLHLLDPSDGSRQAVQLGQTLSEILDVSADGSRLLARSAAADILLVSARGTVQRLTGRRPGFQYSISPDARYLARAASRSLHLGPIHDLDRAQRRKLPHLIMAMTWADEDTLLCHDWEMASLIRVGAEEPLWTIRLQAGQEPRMVAGGGRVAIQRGPRQIEVRGEGNGAVIARLQSPFPVLDLAMSRDGRQVAGRGDPEMALWDVDHSPRPRVLEGVDSGQVLGLEEESRLYRSWFTRDGRFVASPDRRSGIMVWSTDRSLEFRRLVHGSAEDHFVSAMDLSPQRELLASAGWDHRIHLWDTIRGQRLASFEAASAPITSLVFHPDGATLFAATHTNSRFRGELLSFDCRSGQLIDRRELGHGVRRLALSHGGRLLLWCERQVMREGYAPVAFGQLELDAQRPGHLDGKLVQRYASATPDGLPKHCDIIDAGPELPGHALSADHLGRLLRWDLRDPEADPEPLFIAESRPGDQQGWTGAIVRLDAHTVAMGRDAGQLIAIDLRSGDARSFERALPGRTHALALSPDGQRIASGGEDGVLRIWDARSLELLLELRGHEARSKRHTYISCLHWSADGLRLFSGSGDTSMLIWDTESATARRREAARRDRIRREMSPALEALAAQHPDPAQAAAALERWLGGAGAEQRREAHKWLLRHLDTR